MLHYIPVEEFRVRISEIRHGVIFDRPGFPEIDSEPDHAGANTGDQVKGEKSSRSPYTFEPGPENKQGQHVPEQVPETCMDEHIGEKLDGIERLCMDVPESSQRYEIDLKELLDQEQRHIDDEQVSDYWGYVLEHQDFFFKRSSI
jgi:hypothetical protein